MLISVIETLLLESGASRTLNKQTPVLLVVFKRRTKVQRRWYKTVL